MQSVPSAGKGKTDANRGKRHNTEMQSAGKHNSCQVWENMEQPQVQKIGFVRDWFSKRQACSDLPKHAVRVLNSFVYIFSED